MNRQGGNSHNGNSSKAAPVKVEVPLLRSKEWCESHGTHEQALADVMLWVSLAFDCIEHDGQGGLIENRRCPRCLSVLSRPVSLDAAQERLVPLADKLACSIEATRSAMSWHHLWPPPDEPTDELTDGSISSRPVVDCWPANPDDFGAALRLAREEANLTRFQFSELAGVADSTIRNLETSRHRPSPSVRKKVVQALAKLGGMAGHVRRGIA